jgi:hypothetical protein
MYWNNPTINLVYPSDQDPIKDSFHDGVHCLFYDPAIVKTQIYYKQTLQDICDWANRLITENGIDGFIQEQQNWYDIANIVKLNMWIDNIKKQGIVKPILTYYDGNKKLGINNGESRLRALERISGIDTLRGFISTLVTHADQFSHLQQVHTFEEFAQLCQAVDQQKFMFTLTDPEAQYGLYWYEYDSRRTMRVTPGEDYCVEALHLYLKQHPDTKFTPEWFDTLIVWTDYKPNQWSARP